MFDYFHVEDVNMLPISDEEKCHFVGAEFQTKDLGCILTKIVLDSDGKCAVYRNYDSDEILFYIHNVDIVFYAKGKDDIFYQFCATIKKGNLKYIKLILKEKL